MTHKGRAFKVHIGNVNEVSLAAATTQCDVFRQNTKAGLHPRHSLQLEGDISFQQAYDAFVASSEFSRLKPDYKANFRYRMEKYAVDNIDISANRKARQQKIISEPNGIPQ